MEEHATAGIVSTLLEWIEIAALSIELLAVAIIVIATLAGTAVFVRRLLDRSPGLDAYEKYKRQLGRALLLGLEILVAADIVRTVALEPSLTNVGVLAILVVIRTFLSWSLVVEMERRWPWQRGESEPASGPTAES
jgi:uncharacterized membrane protein